jgi:hypothetical protein
VAADRVRRRARVVSLAKSTIIEIERQRRDEEQEIKRGLNAWYRDLVERVRRSRASRNSANSRQARLDELAAIRSAVSDGIGQSQREILRRQGLAR